MQRIDLHENGDALRQVFSAHDRKDFSIDCVLEGTMCKVFADCQTTPKVFLIQNGVFNILGGDSFHESASNILDFLPDGSTILPSPKEWLSKFENSQNASLERYERFSLNHETIRVSELGKIISITSRDFEVIKIDESLAQKIYNDINFKYHLQNFESVSDFLSRGLGYGVVVNNTVVGVASSALVCSLGVEINIMVLPEYRGNSLGKLLAACLIKEVLTLNKIPHWDAANEISCNLAKKLGYSFTGKYSAYRVRKI